MTDHAGLKLTTTFTGKDEVGVRIYETGNDGATLDVELFVDRWCLAGPTDPHHLAGVDDQGGVAQSAHRRTVTYARVVGREFTNVGDE